MNIVSFKLWTSIVCAAFLIFSLAACGPAPEPLSEAQEGGEPAEAIEGSASPTRQKPNQAKTVQKTAPAPAVRSVTLDAGTPIPIITSSVLSTKNNKTGELFQASLSQDIVYDNLVVARRGSMVTGIVADSDQGGRVKGVASLSLRLTKLTFADGAEASIDTTTHTINAESSMVKDATKVGIGAGVGAAIGAIAGGGRGAAIGAGIGGAAGTGTVLATHGDPAVVPSETAITFQLTSPLETTVRP